MISENVISYSNIGGRNVKLSSLKLNSDSLGYYLSAKYNIENNESIRELDIPKIRLPVTMRAVTIRQEAGFYSHPEANIGFGFFELSHDGTRDEVYFTETVLKEKTKEMTIAEIEKELGYKVKIIGD